MRTVCQKGRRDDMGEEHHGWPAGDYALNVLRRVLLLLAAGLLATACAGERFYGDYMPQSVDALVERPMVGGSGYKRIDFVLQGTEDQTIPSILTYPSQGEGPWPCVLFLHGIKQDKEFTETLAASFAEKGFALASFDQYTRGERRLRKKNPVRKAFALRRRCALTVIETRQLISYLQGREDIDPRRIYLLGASYGALTGSIAMAKDHRIRAAVLVCAGGNLRLLFNSLAAKKKLGPAHRLTKRLAVRFFAPADPILHIAGIAPRPVLFQNCTADSLIPVASAKALHKAAGEPKEVLWYEAEHIGADPKVVKQVLDDALAWLAKIDKKIRENPHKK